MGDLKITYYGHSMFLVEDEQNQLVTDPFDESVGYLLPDLEAKVVLVSHGHFDHNNASLVQGASHVINKIEPFPFLMGTLKIEGCPSYHDTCQGKERGENIIFKWHMSGVTFAHMGDYGETGLSEEQQIFLSGTDVLFVPVGGIYTIDWRKAIELVELVKPKVTIPMHYKTGCCQLNIDDAGEFVSSFENPVFHTSTATIFSDKLPETMEVWVLEPCS